MFKLSVIFKYNMYVLKNHKQYYDKMMYIVNTIILLLL